MKEEKFTSERITRRKFLKKFGLVSASTGLLLAPFNVNTFGASRNGFSNFSKNNIPILIGDLDRNGPNTRRQGLLRERIDLTKKSGADSVFLVVDTRSIENSFNHLAALIKYTKNQGVGVVPRLVVDSSKFNKRIPGDPDLTSDSLPDYTDKTQFQSAKNILQEIIQNLEDFPNIIGYQIEWGHWGESWINAAFWNSDSARQSFRDFLLEVAPTLAYTDFDWWWQNEEIQGKFIFYSTHFPDKNPLSEKEKVLQFYWYQYWRNQKTKEITQEFRCTARSLTNKPIIGFSYPGTGTTGYTYTAEKCTDIAFSAKTANPSGPNKLFIRDGCFEGLQLAELDFDTPYLKWEDRQKVIKDSYSKGILPVIFYPHWSSKLSNERVLELVNHIKEVRSQFNNRGGGSTLVVVGNNDVGYSDYVIAPYLSTANWSSTDPPGFLEFLEEKEVEYDIIDASVYSSEIGKKYDNIAVFTPYDEYDDALLEEFYKTNSSVFIFFPSFIVGSPTVDKPFTTSSAIYGMQNELKFDTRSIRHMVWGSEPLKIKFYRDLSDLSDISGYKANHLLGYYTGDFDEVLSEVTINQKDYTFIGKIDDLYFIGADLHIQDKQNRKILFKAIGKLLFNG